MSERTEGPKINPVNPIRAICSEVFRSPKGEQLCALVAEINSTLQEGVQAGEIVHLLSQVPFPVFLDIDGTFLAEDGSDMLHPDAIEAFTRLSKVGTPVYVTSSAGWEQHKQRLETAGLWNDKTILITWENLQYLDRLTPSYERLLESLVTRHAQIFPYTFEQIRIILRDSSFGSKMVASAFSKPYPVPLIDNQEKPLEPNNVGIIPLLVTTYRPTSAVEVPHSEPWSPIPLLDAVKRTELYYTALPKAMFRNALLRKFPDPIFLASSATS